MRIMRNLFCLLMIAAMLGCSSGGDDDTLVNNDPPAVDPDVPPAVAIASLQVLTSNPQIPSDAGLPVTITALLKDANNNFVEGRTVSFAASSGGITVSQPITDTAGRATAELSAAGDPSNRVITVTATVTDAAGDLVESVEVAVTGTQLTITGANSLVQGATDTYTIVLADAAGTGISGETVTVSSSLGNTLASTMLTTDFSGQAQVDYTAVNGGTDTFQASALGETAAATISVSADDFIFVTPAANAEIPLATLRAMRVRWIQNNAPVVGQSIAFSTTRGVLDNTSVVTNANGEASVQIQATNSGFATVTARASNGPTTTRRVEFVAATPDTIEVQADPFTISPNSQSTITAIVRDPDGNLVKNVPVTFNLSDITGGTLSVGTAVTDSQGRAQTFYTSSSATSSQNGVTIEAEVTGGITDSVSLTVAGRELFFTFGTGNDIFEPNTAQYRKEFIVQVTDADGRPVSGVTVSMSAVTSKYLKGFYWANDAADAWSRLVRVSCIDEDTNRNGILDIGEDTNLSGNIEGGNVVTVSPGSFVADENGFGLINLFYAQTAAGWVQIQLEARASVQGTEFSEKGVFAPEALADDVNDLEISPPAFVFEATNLDIGGLSGPVSTAIGAPNGGGPYNLPSSPFGYNRDCSVWEVDD